MPFVNEYISDTDSERFGIKAINKKFVVDATNARDWTIDRERDIYLRNVVSGREEFRHESTWTFYWHGELLWVRLDVVDAGGKRGGPGWCHWKLRHLGSWDSDVLAPHLEAKRAEILADLKDALLAYKDGGVFAANTTFSVALDI